MSIRRAASDFEKYRLTVRLEGKDTLQQGRDPITGLTTWQTWRRKRSLGGGAFAEVHQQVWEDEYYDSHYRAVKVCSERIMKARAIDYKRELSVLAAFSNSEHSGFFVNLHGWWTESESIFIAMEYLRYGDLSKYTATAISEDETKEIADNMLRGLEVMHLHGFTHRDIKPQNILVVQKRPEYSRWWVKIGDFGISKQVLEGSNTGLYTTVGTDHYCAPEVLQFVAQDQDTYSNKVDMWSLGCVLFNISSRGHVPFAPIDLMRYCEGMIAFNPKNLPIYLDGDGITFVKALLRVQPDQRPNATDALQHPWLALLTPTTVNTNSTVLPKPRPDVAPQLPVTQPALVYDSTNLTIRPATTTSITRAPPGNGIAQTTSASATSVPETDIPQPFYSPPPTPVKPAETNITHELAGDSRIHDTTLFRQLSDETLAQQSRSSVNMSESTLSDSSVSGKQWPQNGRVKLQKWFDDNKYHLQDSKRIDGDSPLHLAVQQGEWEIVMCLVEQGADVCAIDRNGLTPIHYAAQYGRPEIAKWLKEQGADIHARDNYRYTPFHYAADSGHLEIVKWLKEQGADIEARNHGGWTRLHLVAHNGRLEVAKWLKEQGADIHAKDHGGWTPLHHAANEGQLEVAKWLKEQGADIDTKDEQGWTPLHHAAFNDQSKVVKWLAEQGADIVAKTNDQDTPLSLAKKRGNREVVRWLRQEGAGTISGILRRGSQKKWTRR